MTDVYIIAEAGVNHNGDAALAHRLVDIAADAKADAVKFQLFDPAELVTAIAPTAQYQAKNLNNNSISQQAMLQALTLPHEVYRELEAHCHERGIDFLCTPFDMPSLNYLVKNTHMRFLKLASGEVTNGPFLLAAARKNIPIILSTGMCNLIEIAEALAILQFGFEHEKGAPTMADMYKNAMAMPAGKITLLHCVSQYPAPVAATNLRAIKTMENAFNLPVGLSDHTLGIAMPIAAAALGACMIEKHFTYDINAIGPDHQASLKPEELHEMVAAIRQVQQGLGMAEKTCQPIEEPTRKIARRSVVAAVAIAAGEPFSEINLTCKRPAGEDVRPNQLWALLGKPARQAYAPDAAIDGREIAA